MCSCRRMLAVSLCAEMSASCLVALLMRSDLLSLLVHTVCPARLCLPSCADAALAASRTCPVSCVQRRTLHRKASRDQIRICSGHAVSEVDLAHRDSQCAAAQALLNAHCQADVQQCKSGRFDCAAPRRHGCYDLHVDGSASDVQCMYGTTVNVCCPLRVSCAALPSCPDAPVTFAISAIGGRDLVHTSECSASCARILADNTFADASHDIRRRHLTAALRARMARVAEASRDDDHADAA